eukprot:10261394-Ditylum_brightwellii.AAC.2
MDKKDQKKQKQDILYSLVSSLQIDATSSVQKNRKACMPGAIKNLARQALKLYKPPGCEKVRGSL